MSKIILSTYVLRILGTILVLLYFFGGGLFYNLFPRFEGMSLNPVFYLGIAFYILGAALYYVVNKKDQKKQKNEDKDDSN